MKKIIFGILLIILSFNEVVLAQENDLVKVYVFITKEGCIYSKQQIEYLKRMDSYGKKFIIVEKELYVDTSSWKRGKDFDLAKRVSTAFKKIGFNQANYIGTPFIVIGDLYAAMTDARDLENVIEEAYKVGDKDVVGCFERNNKDCLDVKTNDKNLNLVWIIVLVSILIIFVPFMILKNKKKYV